MRTSAARSVPERAPAPFVKWVGGKGRLMAQLAPLLPPAVDRLRHVEPFAGGAAMFFHRRPERALLADLNEPLVDTFRRIRDEVEAVIEVLEGLAEKTDEASYYAGRTRYNAIREEPSPERAALFIYLNKTCFNGLHRVNRKGEFNVPRGRYKKPRVLDADGLRAASAALASADLVHASFEEVLGKARPGDFVYFDPPYEPVSATASFTSYARQGFDRDDQRRLRDVFAELTRRGSRCMLSNSDTPFIRELYADFRIDTVAAPRAINCDARRRGRVSEVVVRNYG
jgi:DNA adenine methylase